jgi:arabinogalactan oligomer/maltooligosaccharide transport system substrate-binding protein
MRSRYRILIGVVLAFALIAAACGDDDSADTTEAAPATEAPATTQPPATEPPATEPPATEATTTTGPPETTTTTLAPIPRADADLVIWADDTRTPIFEQFGAEFAAANGITVAVQEIPAIEEIDDRVIQAGPAGEGPDIFISANDVLGGLVANGAVAALDLSTVVDDFAPGAVSAFTFEGQTYGLPYATENIALIRNTDLVPDAPATFAELEQVALDLVAAGTAEVPLAIQQGEGAPYHNFPLFTSFGGYVFGETDDGAYDTSDIGIDSEAGLAAAEAFAAWGESGLMDWDVTYDIMLESFGNGTAPFAITGPWAVPSFENVNFVVEPIPPIEGNEPRPFIGVQGIMVSSFAENPLFANTFVLDFLASQDVQQSFYDADPRGPTHLGVLDAIGATDPNAAGFAASGANGIPIPNIAEMNSVWSPWQDAYQLILTGQEDAVAAFQNAGEQMRNAIG